MATSKEKEAPAKSNGVTKTETTEVSTNLNTISREEALAKLAAMKVGELDSGYLNFKPGDEKRVVFMGTKEIPGIGESKDEKVKAMVFLTDSGKEQINADAVIRSYFERQTVGCARLIRCKGENTTKNGSYKTFDIFELNS